MSIWELFVIAVGLSMDAFAVAVCKGLSVKRMEMKHAVICGLYFGGFQALMPLAGFILGVQFKDLIVQIDGTPVASRADVASALGQKIPGDTVAVTVLRGGQWLTFRVSLMSTPEESS